MNKEIAKLQKKIVESQLKIYQLQDVCPHENVTSKYGANTGGYDGPNFDVYWIDVTCKDCGQWQRFDSKVDKEKYRYYGMKQSADEKNI